MAVERWKEIPGYNGRYLISDRGRIKNAENGLIRTATDNGHGYLLISFQRDGKRKNHYVHRLVAEAFVDNPHGYKYVNHVDYNTRNNNSSNLEWCTQLQNIIHSSCRMKKPKRVTHSNTGEKYISRSKNGLYRLTVNGKEYPRSKTLEEAVQKRDDILRKGVV